MATGKKKRASKTSKGINGAGGKVRLNELQKVLLGQGIFQSRSHQAEEAYRKRRVSLAAKKNG